MPLNTTSQDPCAQELPASGTATLCMILAPPDGSGNATTTVSAPSTPTGVSAASPLRVVIGVALSSAWSLHAAANDSAGLGASVDVVWPDAVASLGVVVLTMAAAPVGGTATAVALVARCATERHPVVVLVQWPENRVSVATEVTTAAATVAAAVGGDLTAATSLALVSMLSCSDKPPKVGINAYAISVFYDLGEAAIAYGNVGLMAAVLALHALLTMALAKARGCVFWDAASSSARFPALSMRVTDFLVPGTMFGLVRCAVAGDAGPVVVGVAGIVVAVGAGQYLLHAVVLPRATFEQYACYATGGAWERVLLFPRGQWQPPALRTSYGVVMVSWERRFVGLRVLDTVVALLLAAGSGMSASTGGVCSELPLLVGVLYLLHAAMFAALRPHRLPSDRAIIPLSTALFGIVCVLAYAQADPEVAPNLQMVVAVAQILKTSCGVWVRHREAQWNPLRKAKRWTLKGLLDRMLQVIWGDTDLSSTKARMPSSAAIEVDQLAMEEGWLELPAKDEVPLVELNDIEPYDDVEECVELTSTAMCDASEASIITGSTAPKTAAFENIDGYFLSTR